MLVFVCKAHDEYKKKILFVFLLCVLSLALFRYFNPKNMIHKENWNEDSTSTSTSSRRVGGKMYWSTNGNKTVTQNFILFVLELILFCVSVARICCRWHFCAESVLQWVCVCVWKRSVQKKREQQQASKRASERVNR